MILSTVKKYQFFSIVTDTIYIFSLQQTEAVSTVLDFISFRKISKAAFLSDIKLRPSKSSK